VEDDPALTHSIAAVPMPDSAVSSLHDMTIIVPNPWADTSPSGAARCHRAYDQGDDTIHPASDRQCDKKERESGHRQRWCSRLASATP
jgi:hypothetical protein